MDVSGWHSLPICGNKIMNEYCLLLALSLSMFDCAVSGHIHEMYAPVCVCQPPTYIAIQIISVLMYVYSMCKSMFIE